MNKTSIAAALCLAVLGSSAHAAMVPKVKVPSLGFKPIATLKSSVATVKAAQALPGLPQVGVILANHNVGGFGNGKLVGASVASIGSTGNGGAVGIALKSGPLSGNGGLVGIAAASGQASGYGKVLSVGLANTGQSLHVGLFGRNLIGH